MQKLRMFDGRVHRIAKHMIYKESPEDVGPIQIWFSLNDEQKYFARKTHKMRRRVESNTKWRTQDMLTEFHKNNYDAYHQEMHDHMNDSRNDVIG